MGIDDQVLSRTDHLRQPLAWGKFVQFGQRIPILLEETVPRRDEGVAVAADVLEMPVEAAAGRTDLLAQPLDLERTYPLLGDQRIARLQPITD